MFSPQVYLCESLIILLSLSLEVIPRCIVYGQSIYHWHSMGTTIFGILSIKIFAKKLMKNSVSLYLIMGWLGDFIVPQIIKQTGPVFWGLDAGHDSYTVGRICCKKKPYFHMIWHLFILAASALWHLGNCIFYVSNLKDNYSFRKFFQAECNVFYKKSQATFEKVTCFLQ